jgi:hypothetical protein
VVEYALLCPLKSGSLINSVVTTPTIISLTEVFSNQYLSGFIVATLRMILAIAGAYMAARILIALNIVNRSMVNSAPRNNTLNTPNLIAIKPPKNPPAMVTNRPNVLATVANCRYIKNDTGYCRCLYGS